MLCTVPRGQQAQLIHDRNAEQVALWVYSRAADAGVEITAAWCKRQFEKIAAHRETCRCNSPCAQAHGCTSTEVYHIAAGWTRAEAKARVLARR